MAGLACADALRTAGARVSVIEKARGPGGRMSTRRNEHASFDHGAQYFTARDPRFIPLVRRWIADGVVREWLGRLAVIGPDGITMIKGDNRRYVGVPQMSSVTRALASSCDLTLSCRVDECEQRGREWWLRTHQGEERGPFDILVAAVPAPQAVPLLAASPQLAERAGSAKLAGCCAAMLAFEPALGLPFDGAFVNLGPLSWIARNSSKPGREGPDAWILHASPDWSEANLDVPPDEVVTLLLSAFANLIGGPTPKPIFAAAHRWRYALPVNPLDVGCLFDGDRAVGACGDWCAAPRVEGAFLSGLALAEEISSWTGLPRP